MTANKAAFWIQAGAISGLIAVVLGAIGAHMLDGYLLKKYAGVTKTVVGQEIPGAVKYMADFKTAAEYQMYHSLALLAVGVVSLFRPSRALNFAGWSFLIGILLFSGSLYFLVLSGIRILGAITPIGGVALIVGWGAFCAAATQLNSLENTAATALD